ncbi:MAG TPA: glutamate--tRNA ligase, partial [Verrucomicrobiae bacterium]|nr:glutamate--tRNA ligase [Verrucomicrobiae bacterium]
REIFPTAQLIKEFSLERVTPSPAIFDNEKLNWLNRQYIKSSPPPAMHELGTGFLRRAGLLPASLNGHVSGWANKLIDLLAPYVDLLEQLPERAGIIFKHDPAEFLNSTENAEVFANDDKKAISVLREFSQRCPDSELSPERFKAIMNEIKSGLGVKGKDLFHPVRIALIGSHSGPDFDRLIPLIEEGSRLELPIKLKSVHERIIDFLAALEHRRG